MANWTGGYVVKQIHILVHQHLYPYNMHDANSPKVRGVAQGGGVVCPCGQRRSFIPVASHRTCLGEFREKGQYQ